MPDVRFELVDRERVSDALLDEIVALYGVAFGRWPHRDPGVPPREHLRWKCSSPATPLAFLVGRRGDRLVLANTIRGSRLRLKGRSCSALAFVDAAVDPAEQGRGVYSAALDYVTGSHRPAYDVLLHEVGVHPAMRRTHGRTGVALPANPVRTRVRVLHPGRMARDWLPGASGLRRSIVTVALAGSALLARAIRPAGRLRAPGRAVPLAAHEGAFDAFFEAASEPFDLIVERTREQLAWRYGDPRAGPFRLTAWEHDGRLLGYSALRVEAGRCDLADLLVLPGRTDVAAALVGHAVREARRVEAAGLSCWLPGRHPYRGPLVRAGFFDARRRGGFLYRPMDLPAEEVAFLARPDARIHLTLGDSDLI